MSEVPNAMNQIEDPEPDSHPEHTTTDELIQQLRMKHNGKYLYDPFLHIDVAGRLESQQKKIKRYEAALNLISENCHIMDDLTYCNMASDALEEEK